jgi:hypothetical protein
MKYDFLCVSATLRLCVSICVSALYERYKYSVGQTQSRKVAETQRIFYNQENQALFLWCL